MCRGGVCIRMAWGVMSCEGRGEVCGSIGRGEGLVARFGGRLAGVVYFVLYEYVFKYDL